MAVACGCGTVTSTANALVEHYHGRGRRQCSLSKPEEFAPYSIHSGIESVEVAIGLQNMLFFKQAHTKVGNPSTPPHGPRRVRSVPPLDASHYQRMIQPPFLGYHINVQGRLPIPYVTPYVNLHFACYCGCVSSFYINNKVVESNQSIVCPQY